MKVVVEQNQCRGCRVCELACSYYSFGEFNPKRSRIKVVKLEHAGEDIPVVCVQCGKCIGQCPLDALKMNENGWIVVDEGKCIGCGQCVEFCPLGAITLDPKTAFASVCDVCAGDPKCVRYCPAGALTIDTRVKPNLIAQRTRARYARRSLGRETEAAAEA